MAGFSTAFDRTKCARIADGLMVAVAVALPWSTSLVGILLVLWLVVITPSLAWGDLRRELRNPAGGLPVLLVLLAMFGMIWADVSFIERWKGLDGFVKLLIIPLLIAQFRQSDNGKRVFVGFLIGCFALLIASWAVTIWPALPKDSTDLGVVVKSYIVQSAEFTICAAGLLYLAVDAAQHRRWAIMAGLIIFSFAFLEDIFFIATSRTTLVVIPALFLLYGVRRFGWKGFVGAIGVGLILGAALWTSSPFLRDRAIGVYQEVEAYTVENKTTPSGERIMYWTRSLRFIESAPLLGHGTGSITEMFRGAAVGHSGARAEVSTNPHNQTFAVAIQLGLLGAAVLWAMWVSHFLLFRGRGLAAWLGIVIVTQNIVGSLFNSFLFDFTEGWLYVVGVGVTAGMILQTFDAARADLSEGVVAPVRTV